MEPHSHNYENFDEALVALEQYDEVQFESGVLKAQIKKAELEQGLFLYNWHFTFRDAYTFIHRHQPGKEQYLLLICQFSPMLSHIHIRGAVEKQWSTSKPYYMLLSSESEVSFNSRKGSRAKCITVLMTRDWLSRQLQSARHEITARSLHEPRVEPLVNSIPSRYVELAAQLYNDLKANHSLLSLKGGVYQLISQCLEMENSGMVGYDEPDPMQHVETYIISCLYAKLPPLIDLAKIANMSVSSFKRNFKKRFGTGVYEYFLNHKMELARDMIVNRHLNIGQVAFELGYESFSHFSQIFTRHFGEHPGSFKNKSL